MTEQKLSFEIRVVPKSKTLWCRIFIKHFMSSNASSNDRSREKSRITAPTIITHVVIADVEFWICWQTLPTEILSASFIHLSVGSRPSSRAVRGAREEFAFAASRYDRSRVCRVATIQSSIFDRKIPHSAKFTYTKPATRYRFRAQITRRILKINLALFTAPIDQRFRRHEQVDK